jgi:hypothetical protein
MSPHPSPRPHPSPTVRRVASVLLIAFALGGLIVENSQLLHLHKGESAGLYNEQHVLAALLATPSSGVPLPDAPAVAFLAALVGLVALFAGTRPAVSVARHAAPRAPPAR